MFGQKEYKLLELTKENILRRIQPEYIFSYYIPGLVINKRISSPLRKDRNPSFIVGNKFGKIGYKDFSTGESGNCFDFVQVKFNCTFLEALKIINRDLGIGLSDENGNLQSSVPVRREYEVREYESSERSIKIKSRKWSSADKAFWSSFGISRKTLELYEVKPLEFYWLDDYCFKVKGLAYSYRFDTGIYKIYQPHNEFKWMYNGSGDIIQGLKQLEFKSNYIVITKSLKDVMLLRELGIESIAPQAESVVLKEPIMNVLYDYYDTVYTLSDYDNAGIHFAWMMRRLYNTKPLFLTDKVWNRGNGLKGSKDISDYTKFFGIGETKKLIDECKRNIII